MYIYLPIAEMPVNVLLILGLGMITGILSGMFGIGGGFLATPFLIFLGVPPPVAVASSTNQIVASSVSGFLVHWRKKQVDFQLGTLMLVGGFVGSFIGVWIFAQLQKVGQIDLVISLIYVTFLFGVGSMMAIESGRSIIQQKSPVPKKKKGRRWLDRLPLQRYFTTSDLEVSLLLPILVGLCVGLMVSLMGIGGGLVMIPAMIYLLGMPASVVVGTSLFQSIFVTANVTMLQAIKTQTVDIFLALLLLASSVVGAQLGTRMAGKLPAENMRFLLALLVLSVGLKLALGLFTEPDNLFSITVIDS